MRPGSALTPWLIESIVRLGTCLPFAQVPALVMHFTGVTVSPATVRRLTEGAGATLVTHETTAVADLARILPDPPLGPPVQQVSVDGAMVPLVGGVWAEVKTLAVGMVTTDPDGRTSTTALSYFSRLADATTFGALATLETQRRGTTTAGTVVAVSDGAEWCQGCVDLHRPDAVRILDFPHAVEHLGQVAQAVFGVGTAAASEWLGRQTHALRHGQQAHVLDALTGLRARAELGSDAQAVVRQTLGYLGGRREQIRYQAFAAAGYPLGSGCVESANKLVVEARLKGPGMHWARANVNPMLALRTAVANDRWSETWAALWPSFRRQPGRPPGSGVAPDRSAPRHQPGMPSVDPPAAGAPPSSPPRPKLVVNGKPTADHPWRRSSPLRAKR